MEVLVLTTYDEAPFLLAQLDALEDRGVSTTLLPVGGEVTAGTSRSVRDYLAYFETVRTEAARGYDLIHAHYGLTLPMALAQRHLPVVATLWGTDLAGPGRPVTEACVSLCADVIVMTEGMQSTLKTDSTVLPFGIDLETFRPMAQARAQKRVGWDPERNHVLFPYPPARTVKNHPRAERIVRVVDNLTTPPVDLEVVSGVDHDLVPVYMNAADALLMTSDHEGSPTAVKEATACNLPVVSLDVGDVRTRLAGVSPSVVATSDEELIDGLRAVLESGERSNGREAAQAVSRDRIVDRLLEIYRRVGSDSAHTQTTQRPMPPTE